MGLFSEGRESYLGCTFVLCLNNAASFPPLHDRFVLSQVTMRTVLTSSKPVPQPTTMTAALWP